jgi:hypothetical protein
VSIAAFIRLLTAGVALIVTLTSSAASPIVSSAAPSFSGGKEQGRSVSLTSLRGKPVILLIASSPKDRSFRRQLSELRGRYERLAAKGMIGFVAFTGESGQIRSNIPFLTVDRPADVASLYDVSNGFAVVVIGVDGNLDCLSTKPLPGQRILDIFNNNASVQQQLRR